LKPAWLILPCILVVQGCALPVPVRVASWAIDGIVMVATKKSVPEHGISMIAQKDCSFLRGVTEQQFCIEYPNQGTAVAAADGAAAVPLEDRGGPAPLAPQRANDIADLAAFETAAGATTLKPATDTDSASVTALAAIKAAKAGSSPMISLGEAVRAKIVDPDQSSPPIVFASVSPSIPMPPPVPIRRRMETRAEAPAPPFGERARIANGPREKSVPGVYYVVGSFVQSANAAKLAQRHAAMDPAVIAANLDGRQVYRVIIGPFAGNERKGAKRRLSGAEIYDAWAINLDPASWTLVRQLMPKPQEIAGSVFAVDPNATY
jgi:hypothetical protein